MVDLNLENFGEVDSDHWGYSISSYGRVSVRKKGDKFLILKVIGSRTDHLGIEKDAQKADDRAYELIQTIGSQVCRKRRGFTLVDKTTRVNH